MLAVVWFPPVFFRLALARCASCAVFRLISQLLIRLLRCFGVRNFCSAVTILQCNLPERFRALLCRGGCADRARRLPIRAFDPASATLAVVENYAANSLVSRISSYHPGCHGANRGRRQPIHNGKNCQAGPLSSMDGNSAPEQSYQRVITLALTLRIISVRQRHPGNRRYQLISPELLALVLIRESRIPFCEDILEPSTVTEQHFRLGKWHRQPPSLTALLSPKKPLSNLTFQTSISNFVYVSHV